MMEEPLQHLLAVLLAYSGASVAVLGLVIWVLWRAHWAKARLAEAEVRLKVALGLEEPGRGHELDKRVGARAAAHHIVSQSPANSDRKS